MISIIVPVYNAQETLKKCVASLIGQTYQNTEIILVNDGSSDASGDIAQHYADAYDNIYCYSQTNKGVSAARNLGLSAARGEYVAFVDADDWVEPNYLQSLLRIIETNNCEYAYADWCVESDSHSACDSLETYGYQFDKDPASLIRFYLLHRDGCAPWAKLFRRDIVEQYNLGFREGLPLAEDYLFILNYLLHVHTICRDSSAYYHYSYNSVGSCYRVRKNFPEIQDTISEELRLFNERSDGRYTQEYLLASVKYNAVTVIYLRRIVKQRSDWRDILYKKANAIRSFASGVPRQQLRELKANERLVANMSILGWDALLATLIYLRSKVV